MPSKGGVANGTGGIYNFNYYLCNRLHTDNKKEIDRPASKQAV
nr:MAG TPA: hypothetical protein [Caudoviricetes sp.]